MQDHGEVLAAVRTGMIPAHVYNDKQIFSLEKKERLFSRAWLFVAHESEIPQPGGTTWSDKCCRIRSSSLVILRARSG